MLTGARSTKLEYLKKNSVSMNYIIDMVVDVKKRKFFSKDSQDSTDNIIFFVSHCDSFGW